MELKGPEWLLFPLQRLMTSLLGENTWELTSVQGVTTGGVWPGWGRCVHMRAKGRCMCVHVCVHA